MPSDHPHIVVHIDHSFFAEDLDEIALKHGNAFEHGFPMEPQNMFSTWLPLALPCDSTLLLPTSFFLFNFF